VIRYMPAPTRATPKTGARPRGSVWLRTGVDERVAGQFLSGERLGDRRVPFYRAIMVRPRNELRCGRPDQDSASRLSSAKHGAAAAENDSSAIRK